MPTTQYSSIVPITSSDIDFDEFEPTFPPHQDLPFLEWEKRLLDLSSSETTIRRAELTGADGRRMEDLQTVCVPITVRSVRMNVGTIADETVLIAEIDSIHVGYCIVTPGRGPVSPLFIKVVAVAPAAQRRGVGLALLLAASTLAPRRDIALATQDDNLAARSMNDKFASAIGASIRRVKLDTYRNTDLGIRRGMGYRAWLIERPVE